MIKHSLFRSVGLFLISFIVFNYAVPAFAATSADDQVEKDLQAEELNIGFDSSEMSQPTAPVPMDAGISTSAQKDSTDLSQELNAVDSSAAISAEPAQTTDNLPKQDLRAANDNDGYIIDERDYSKPTIHYEQVVDYTKPYKQRRSRHGLLLGLGMENVDPVDYYSVIDDVAIKDMLGGSAISMLNVELGYKYNFSLGAVYLMGSYAMGKISDTTEGVSRKLELSRLNLSIGYQADMLFDEPWVVPYGQVGIHQFDVTETKDTESSSVTTEPSLNYRVGLLFQLNWIEKAIDSSTHTEGLRSSGLENTYLDVYAQWYEPTASAAKFDPNDTTTYKEDPDLRSEATLGVALKMEF